MFGILRPQPLYPQHTQQAVHCPISRQYTRACQNGVLSDSSTEVRLHGSTAGVRRPPPLLERARLLGSAPSAAGFASLAPADRHGHGKGATPSPTPLSASTAVGMGHKFVVDMRSTCAQQPMPHLPSLPKARVHPQWRRLRENACGASAWPRCKGEALAASRPRRPI